MNTQLTWQNLDEFNNIFVHLGLNQADMLKSSSILICWYTRHIIYTQSDWHGELKGGENNYYEVLMK
jgi:hypothetical protein